MVKLNMVSIYEHTNYREYLAAWIDETQKQKSQARGIKGRLATAAQVSPAMMSLILKGQKHMTMEQAAEVAEFLNLNEIETDYFFLLVELGKAGSFKLEQKLKRKLRELQANAKKISARVKKDRELTDEEKAIYYSNWIYTGVRNLSAIPEFGTIDKIAQRLHVPENQVLKTVEFLSEHGLIKKENGQLTFGPTHMHVGSDSPFVMRHHQNWRLRGFQFMEQHTESNLFYTCPMSLSHEAVEEVRKLLPKVIEQVLKIVGPSPSERAFCFNMDWYEY